MKRTVLTIVVAACVGALTGLAPADMINISPLATASDSRIKDGNLTTYVSWYNNFPRSVSLTWSEPMTFEKVVFTFGRVGNWELKDADGASILTGTYGTAAVGTQEVTFDPVTTTKLELVIKGRSSGSSGGQTANVYEVDVFQAVPEPATLALLGVGGVAIGLRRRRA